MATSSTAPLGFSVVTAAAGPETVLERAAATETTATTTVAASPTATRDRVQQTVGVLGGGQLGRMMTEAASRLGVHVCVLDPGENAPAAQVGADQVVGKFDDPAMIEVLALRSNLLTVEIEHVDADAIEAAVAATGVRAEPSPATIRVIQDKLRQKMHFRAVGLPLDDFAPVHSREDLRRLGAAWGWPLMLKARRLAYDGRGNAVVRSGADADIDAAVEALGGFTDAGRDEDDATTTTTTTSATTDAVSAVCGDRVPRGRLFAERWVGFARELAVMVVRSIDGSVRSYPCVETYQEDSICHTVIAPAPVSGAVLLEAQRAAETAVASLDGAGIFGVELFHVDDPAARARIGAAGAADSVGVAGDSGRRAVPWPWTGAILVNEVAPRPHNSGHYTMEACECDQFENHVRAVLGLPLGSTALRVGGAVMLNVLGRADGDEGLTRAWALMAAGLATPGAGVHWYGKQGARRGRKLGHITVTGSSPMEAAERARQILERGQEPIRPASPLALHHRTTPSAASSSSFASSSSSSSTSSSSSSSSSSSASSASSSTSSSMDVRRVAAPMVGVIMGSDSDLPTMRPAAEVLTRFGVPFELTIVSAHRTPDRMVEYARSARGRGLRLLIAAAGGAAHLPGMVAALTPLPVIGVPVPLHHLDGVDSLHSIVQMPRGIPVATVAIGNATNAALLAVRMLSVAMPHLADAMECYQEELEQQVLHKVDVLERVGWEAYGK